MCLHNYNDNAQTEPLHVMQPYTNTSVLSSISYLTTRRKQSNDLQRSSNSLTMYFISFLKH